MSDRRFTRRSMIQAALPAAVGVVALLQACGASPTVLPPGTTTAPTAGATSPPANSAQVTAPAVTTNNKYRGKELRYACLSGGMGDAAAQWGQPWLDANGVKLVRGLFGQQELEDKILQATATNTYLADLYQFPSWDAGDVMGNGFLLEVPEAIKASVNMDDVLPVYRNRLLTWNGKQYALPFDGDKHMMGYRGGDLFADPNNQTKFRAKYGYDLPQGGPQTWSEHRDLAEFFSGRDWDGNGKVDEAGFSHMTQRKDTLYWGFISRATAYTKHPDDLGFHFDVDTMEPRINNPGFVRALTEWKNELEKFGLPGAKSMTWSDSNAAFRGGRVAMSVGWWGVGESDPKNSTIRESVRYTLLPGSKEVYNSKAKQWETRAEINHAPFLAAGGWTLAVPKNSKEPDMAFDFAAYLASPATSLKMVTNPTGCQPYRTSHLAKLSDWTDDNVKMVKVAAETYLAAEKATMEHPNIVLDLRIPGFSQYRDAAELSVSQALAGEKAPQDALDACATAWKDITQRLGSDKQKALYAAAVAK